MAQPHEAHPNTLLIYNDALKLSSLVPQTRFFTVEPGQWEDQVHCRLKTESLARKPVYDAISYAWGETAGEEGPARETILINDYEFEISANLASALRHFRHADPDKLLWADAISHNQYDPIELNQQVSKMREIYQRSQAVRIWLGKESQLSHPVAKAPSEQGLCVFQSGLRDSNDKSDDYDSPLYKEDPVDNQRVKRYKRKFYDFYNLPLALQHNSTQDFRKGSFCFLHILARDDHMIHQDLAFLQDLSSRDGIFEALREMMNRQWWTRQWVIQETVLAKTVTVHYGRFVVPWEMLTMALKTFQIHRQKACCTTEYAKLRTSDLDTLHHFAQTVRDIDTWRTVWVGQPNAPIRLLPLLWQFRQRRTGRLPDKIYALLPLVKDWGEESALEVHYDWDVAHIYADLVRLLIDVHDSLLPLMGTTRKSAALASRIPSWAPDWTVEPDSYELARLDRTLLYHAGGERQHHNGKIPVDGEYHTRLRFDTKPNVKFYEAAGKDRFQFLELRGLLQDEVSTIGLAMPLNSTAAIRKTYSDWSRIAFADDDPASLYVTKYCAKSEAYWRTLCMDTEFIGREADDDNLPLHKQDYQRAGSSCFKEFVARIECKRKFTECGPEQDDGSPTFLQNHKRYRNSTWRPEPSPQSLNAINGNNGTDGTYFSLHKPGGLARRSTTMRSEDEINEIAKINEATKTATTDRRFFLTKQGYMGLGPKQMEAGDLIAVLVGGHTPFVLRPTEEKEIDSEVGVKQCYALDGDCYVHGLMDGEAFKKIKIIDETNKLYLE